MQLGAELFGHAGVEGDIEIQRLMVKTLQASGVKALQIDFNHVGIFDALMKNTDPIFEKQLYQALQSKDQTEVKALTIDLDGVTRDALCALTELNGDVAILAEAAKRLPKTLAITKALAELLQVSNQLKDLEVGVSFDLAELRGYHYHSGMVFAAYAQGCPGPLALGGRYDEVGQAFGRARPAAGFSLDLRGLVKALPPSNVKQCILAPYGNDDSLIKKIDELRKSGEKVVQELPGHEAYVDELNFNRKLKNLDGVWQVVAA
jgi:ATP phosphoribosyltransferase regulatory subunit